MDWRSYQQRQEWMELKETSISYLDSGQGRPVVFLHGIPTWGYLWHETASVLSAQRRVLVPDLIGFGNSDKSDRFNRGIDRQADWIREWLERLGVSRADFVAHDIGGGVALRLAVFYPDLIERLCLMNTVCYDSWPVEMMLQLGHPEAYRKFSVSMLIRLLKRALKAGFARSPAAELLEGIVSPYATETGKLSLIRNAAALNTNLTTEITPKLGRIRAPVFILWGEEDKFQPARYGERLARDLPNARFVRVPKARHFVMLDQPRVVAAELNAFLSAGGSEEGSGRGRVRHARVTA